MKLKMPRNKLNDICSALHFPLIYVYTFKRTSEIELPKNSYDGIVIAFPPLYSFSHSLLSVPMALFFISLVAEIVL